MAATTASFRNIVDGAQRRNEFMPTFRVERLGKTRTQRQCVATRPGSSSSGATWRAIRSGCAQSSESWNVMNPPRDRRMPSFRIRSSPVRRHPDQFDARVESR